LGGGVYCASSNTLLNNTYSNCKPNNTNCGDQNLTSPFRLNPFNLFRFR